MSELDSSTDVKDVGNFLVGVGKRLRARRRQLKLTLKELSQKTDVPLSTLSKVETGQMSLNIQKLVAVCGALNVDVMRLVSPDENEEESRPKVTGRRAVTRLSDVQHVRTSQANYGHHAVEFSKRRMRPATLELPVGQKPELIRHQGEEFVYVLEGEVEIITEFYEPTRLMAGESIYIDATMAHNVQVVGSVPAKILNVMSVSEEEVEPTLNDVPGDG